MEKRVKIAQLVAIAASTAFAYTNPLQKEVVSGEVTLDPSELAGYDALEKTGAGTLILPDISSFTGDIVVKAGTVKTSVAGGLGDTVGKTVVEAGAQLYLDASAADLDFSGETMEIASRDSSIAIYLDNKENNRLNLGVLRLAGDAKIYFSSDYVWGTDCNLGGNTLTVVGGTANVFLHRTGRTTPGSLIADRIRILLRGQATFEGGSACRLATRNAASLSFFQFSGAVPWTLSPQQNLSVDVRYAGGTDGTQNVYAGPVDLSAASVALARGSKITNAGMTFSGKVSGSGGFTTGAGDIYKNFTVHITNPENDFTGGAAFNESTLHLPVSGALPTDGGELLMKNGTVVLTNALAYALPSATFEGTGVVDGVSATGTWKNRLTKTGEGTLRYDTYVGAPVLELQGGTFRMPIAKVTTVTNRVTGLNSGSRTFDNATDVANFYASGVCITNSTVDRPTMAYKCGTGDGWTANTAYTYDGFIWNRSLTNETWRFVVCMTTKGKILVDGNLVVECGSAANSTASYGGARMGTVEVEPGPHRIEMRMYVTTVGTSTSSGGGAYQNNKADWIANCGFTWGQRRGMMMDRLGRDGQTYSDFDYIVDAGDGDLLTLTDDDDVTTRLLPAFETVVATNGAATLDMNGNDAVVGNLMGFPAVVNGGRFTVTNDWRLTALDTATFDGAVEFAAGTTLTLEGVTAPSAESEWTILTAADGVTGLPAVVAGTAKGKWSLSSDGASLKLTYRPKGFSVVIR